MGTLPLAHPGGDRDVTDRPASVDVPGGEVLLLSEGVGRYLPRLFGGAVDHCGGDEQY